MMLFLKALFITFIRFFMITALVTSLLYFDPSPLPEAVTIVTLSYLIHIGVTFLFAKWAFHNTSPTWWDAGMVAAVFLIVGTLLEAGLSSLITRNSFWASFINYNWQSLLIALLYVATVFAAAWHTRHHTRKAARPSGML